MNPQLSYYYGRQVTSVDPTDGGWEVKLEGDVRIVNTDDQYDIPDASLVGKAFQTSVYEQAMTRLFFGTDDNPRSTVMFLNPSAYGISDPAYEGGAITYPQADNLEAPAGVEADTSAERVADGPSEEWLAAQSAPDPELTPDEEEDQ